MTRAFDKTARDNLAAMPENFAPIDYRGEKLGDLVIRQITPKEARPFIASYHYTKTFPDSSKYVFAGYFGTVLGGIVVYGMGGGKGQYTSLIPDIQNGEYVELTRLWSPDGMPKNIESKLIGGSLKLLPQKIKLVISFADPSRKHRGTIYQATNFIYCGMSLGGKVLIKDGIEAHPRLLGIYKMRRAEFKNKKLEEIRKILGWEYKPSAGKHRYVMLRGRKLERKRMYKFLEHRVCPYPKIESIL